MITIEIKSSYLADCPNYLYRQTIRRVLKSKLLNQSYQIDGTNLEAMITKTTIGKVSNASYRGEPYKDRQLRGEASLYLDLLLPKMVNVYVEDNSKRRTRTDVKKVIKGDVYVKFAGKINKLTIVIRVYRNGEIAVHDMTVGRKHEC